MVQLVNAGTVLNGRYVIDREIGRGGMATVFVAEDLRQRRRVAVKILRPDVALALGSARFLSEIEIASRLTHPHILPVHDSGEDAGVLYYVMPYVEGESLPGEAQPRRPAAGRGGARDRPRDRRRARLRARPRRRPPRHQARQCAAPRGPCGRRRLRRRPRHQRRRGRAGHQRRVHRRDAGLHEPRAGRRRHPRRPHRRVRARLRGVRDAHRDAAVSRRDPARGLREASVGPAALPARAPPRGAGPGCRGDRARAGQAARGPVCRRPRIRGCAPGAGPVGGGVPSAGAEGWAGGARRGAGGGRRPGSPRSAHLGRRPFGATRHSRSPARRRLGRGAAGRPRGRRALCRADRLDARSAGHAARTPSVRAAGSGRTSRCPSSSPGGGSRAGGTCSWVGSCPKAPGGV